VKLKIILKIQNENEFHFWKWKSFFENENENYFLKTKILLGLLFNSPRASEKESLFFLFFNYIILYKLSSCQLKVFSNAKISPIARILHQVRATVMTTVVKTRPQYLLYSIILWICGLCWKLCWKLFLQLLKTFVENFVENLLKTFQQLLKTLLKTRFDHCGLCWKLVFTNVHIAKPQYQ
jgi:hypothetical protein